MPNTLVGSKWVNGNLTFFDKTTGNNIMTISQTAVTLGGNASMIGNLTASSLTVTTLASPAGNLSFQGNMTATGNMNFTTLSGTAGTLTIPGNVTVQTGNLTLPQIVAGTAGSMAVVGNVTLSTGNLTLTLGNLSVPNMKSTFTSNGVFWFDGNTTKVRA